MILKSNDPYLTIFALFFKPLSKHSLNYLYLRYKISFFKQKSFNNFFYKSKLEHSFHNGLFVSLYILSKLPLTRMIKGTLVILITSKLIESYE